MSGQPSARALKEAEELLGNDGVSVRELALYLEGVRDGAAEAARAAIVRWLRLPNRNLSLQSSHKILCLVADAIEQAKWKDPT